ncbi:MAG: site-specific DNA-methyltransferase [Schwartzia succinivorans]|nr:site-specific DNA-methyltransferase [Schwartzia succinivorans]
MPRKKKLLSDAEVAKIRDIEAYDHSDKKRANNPPVGLAKKERVAEEMTKYAFDPHIDPTLDWAGKAEGVSFEVPASSIHIHESIKPSKILRAVQAIGDDVAEAQLSLFESPLERMRRRQASLEFYKHGVDWTNRLIAGDSLVIMNSLLEKEGMAGQVQMVYIDPPYGIKYGSNFQPFVGQRDVKDKKDEDLSQEPETIKAFRDTWELGIHSYLTYLRNRLLLARELLADTGSVFVQISDENVHRVRCICDEVFGADNYVSIISFQKTGSLAGNLLNNTSDYIVWYAKNKSSIKYHQLYLERKKGDTSLDRYDYIELNNGTIKHLSRKQIEGIESIPEGKRVRYTTLLSDGESNVSNQIFKFEGEDFSPRHGKHWKTTQAGLAALVKQGRIQKLGTSLWYKRYVDDFPVIPMTNQWESLQIGVELLYVVQTASKAIQRCMLMTTDPGDLVLDITCGSGTTAYVAEQWGRRWITCDTSRVAIELAKERLMTATFDYYRLAHPEQGVGSGFVYKTVPHITLKSIANDEPPATETLYDQPEIDKTKVRISGPFTVESLPAPVVRPLDESAFDADAMDLTAKQGQWRDELLATGILGKNGARLEFARVEPLSDTAFFQAEAETKDGGRAIICFGSETKVMDARYIAAALDEAEARRPYPEYIIFAAFQFGPEAAKMLDEAKWPGVTILKAQMNTDLMTDDLKKKRSSNESFWLVGQPDVELIRDKRSKKKYKVRVRGFDYYDVKTGKVKSGTDRNIAMWMLDTDYDGMAIEPHQVFFPMAGAKGGWTKLAKTLKAEIDQEWIQQYAGSESLWFEAEPYTRIAVKIIDDRGIESMRVLSTEA